MDADLDLLLMLASCTQVSRSCLIAATISSLTETLWGLASALQIQRKAQVLFMQHVDA